MISYVTALNVSLRNEYNDEIMIKENNNNLVILSLI